VAAGKVMPLVRRRWITGEGNDEDGEEGLHAFSDVEKVVRALHCMYVFTLVRRQPPIRSTRMV
jgi:hypothetical protein